MNKASATSNGSHFWRRLFSRYSLHAYCGSRGHSHKLACCRSREADEAAEKHERRTATQRPNGMDGSWLARPEQRALNEEHSRRVSTLERFLWTFLSSTRLPASNDTRLWLLSNSHSSCPHALLTRTCSPLVFHSLAFLTLQRRMGSKREWWPVKKSQARTDMTEGVEVMFYWF